MKASTLDLVRYEARAYGTREEIRREIEAGMGAHRSERRQRISAAAIAQLDAGALEVWVKPILYVVTDQPDGVTVDARAVPKQSDTSP